MTLRSAVRNPGGAGPSTIGRLGRTTLALLALAFAVAGCRTKKNLDRTVDKLIATLQDGDYDELQAMIEPSSDDPLTEEKAEMLTATIRELGAYRGRSMEGISVASGDRSKGTYELTFEKGTVELELAMVGERILGFDFSGPAVKEAMQRVVNARYAEFAVRDFKFVDEEGEPRPGGNVAKAGEPVHFRIVVQGVTPKDGKYRVHTRMQPQDAERRPLGDPVDFEETVIDVDPDEPPVVSLKAWIETGRPGTFPLVFDVRDVNAGRSLEYLQTLVVEP